MGYLDRLKKIDQTHDYRGELPQEHHTRNHQNLRNPEKWGSDGFDGVSYSVREEKNAAGDTVPGTRASRWLLHYTDRQPEEAIFAPPATHAEVLHRTPDAVAAEPAPERITRTANLIERDELLALVEAIYSHDADQDRQDAIDAALADPEGALCCYRAIAAERGIEVRMAEVRTQTAIVGCKSCRHRKQPGRADPGYCAARDDLPGAYGLHHPLRKLPDDLGVGCANYTPHEGGR